MTEEKKDKKPRGPRKTPFEQLEVERDKFKARRDHALDVLNAANAEQERAQATYDAAQLAFSAMDDAVNRQKMAAAPKRDAKAG
jgi:hypothetical protein